MTYEPLGGHLALELVRATAGSARPDAPVVPDRTARRTRRSPDARLTRARARVATELRTVAHWIEPAARPTNACQNG